MNNRLIKKYHQMSAPVKAGLWFTLCTFLQRAVNMITTPIFTRVLSTEEYGVYSTYMSWENVFFLIFSLSLHRALLNVLTKNQEKKESVLSSVCGLGLVVASIWSALGLIFWDKLPTLLGLPRFFVACLFIFSIAQFAMSCWTIYEQYIYSYKALVFVTLLSTIGSSLLGVAFVLLIQHTAQMRVFASTVVVAVISLILYSRIFRKGKKFYDKNIWAFALSFAVPLLPSYLSEFILMSSDKIMINYMCTSSDVAVYSIAYAVGTLISLVMTSINSAFVPYVYQKIKSCEFKLLAKKVNQILVVVACALVILMLFGKEIVLIFGGAKYAESVELIIPISLGIYFNFVLQLFSRVQEYFERKKAIMIPSISCAVLNVILNYVFIEIYGYRAAAYTTFACYLIFCVIHYVFYISTCNAVLSGMTIYRIKPIAIISLIVIGSGIGISLINTNMWTKYAMLIVIAAIAIIYRKRIIPYISSVFGK